MTKRIDLLRVAVLFLATISFWLSIPTAFADLIYANKVICLDTAGNANYYKNYNASNSSAGDNNRWVTTNPNGSSAYYLNNQPDPVLLFDLGTNQTIDSLSLFGYNVQGNSVKTFTLSFYDSANGFNSTPVSTQNYTVGYTQDATVLALDSSVNARYVKMTMTDNFNGDRVGFGNLLFNVSSAVIPTTVAETVGTAYYTANNLLDRDPSTQWVTTDVNGGNSWYYDNDTPAPVLKFSFDNPQTLTGINLQSYGVSGNTARDFSLKFFDQAGEEIAVDPNLYTFSKPNSSLNVSDTLSFPAVEGVASVEMTITNNFIGVGSGKDRVGLSTVNFNTLPDSVSGTTPVSKN